MVSRIRFAVLALALVGCSAPVGLPSPPPAPVADDAAPPAAPASDAGAGVYDGGGPVEWTDAGWVSPTYDVARSEGVTGAQGAQSVQCNAGDVIIAAASGCAVNGGQLVSGGPSEHGWTCVGAPDVPAKGATIIAWVQCRRGAR